MAAVNVTSLEFFLLFFLQYAQKQLFKLTILVERYSNITGLFFVFLFTVNSI